MAGTALGLAGIVLTVSRVVTRVTGGNCILGGRWVVVVAVIAADTLFMGPA